MLIILVEALSDRKQILPLGIGDLGIWGFRDLGISGFGDLGIWGWKLAMVLDTRHLALGAGLRTLPKTGVAFSTRPYAAPRCHDRALPGTAGWTFGGAFHPPYVLRLPKSRNPQPFTPQAGTGPFFGEEAPFASGLQAEKPELSPSAEDVTR